MLTTSVFTKKRAASKAELDKLEFVRDELNQVIELYKRAKRDEGSSILSDVLRGLQEFQRRNYLVQELREIDDDENEEPSAGLLQGPSVAVDADDESSVDDIFKPSPWISLPEFNLILLQFLKKLVEDGDFVDPISKKRIHITKKLQMNEYHLIKGKMEFLTFKFGVQPFINALYEEILSSGLIQNPKIVNRARDIKDFILQERENIIAKYSGNKAMRMKGTNFLSIMAKNTPGGWLFGRYPIEFLEKEAPDAYCGNHYVWTPTISDPKLELAHGDWTLECYNLPSWMTICNLDTLTGVPPSLESARYMLELKATYRRFGELKEITATIPLTVRKVE